MESEGSAEVPWKRMESESAPRKRVKKRVILVREATAVCAALAAYAVCSFFFAPAVAPARDTWTGQVNGRVDVSRQGRPFHAYKGIPYAQPPVGKLRFQSPRPPLRWAGVRDGGKEGPYCLQIDLLPRMRRGEEDCLYLNVFTPLVGHTPPRPPPQNKLLPVLVFFHGGGFVSGGLDNFGAHYFMDEQVVLVTLHYRLGVFGFLSTGDRHARGNMGLKDQVAALQWVQGNIRHFGGDAQRVTIFGESAGGASVHFHMLSNMSNGLFHGGISQSATGLLKFVFNGKKGRQNEVLSRQTGCALRTSQEFVECLRGVDAVALVELQRWLTDPPRDTDLMFLPSIEGLEDEEAFLTQHPLDLLANGSFSRLPWMTGINSEDGLLLSAELMTHPHKLAAIQEDWLRMAPYLNLPANATLLRQIKDFYFNASFDLRSLSHTNPNVLEPLTSMYSDRIFFASNHVAAVMQARFAPVYLYFFSHKFQISMIDIMKAVRAEDTGVTLYEILLLFLKNWFYRTFTNWDPRFPGVAHAEEMLLQFSILPLPHIAKPSDSEDYRMSRELVRTWVQFASDHRSLSFNNVTWMALSVEDAVPVYMNLNYSNPSMIPEPFHERITFWKSIGIH